MKTYKERTASILQKAEVQRKKRKRIKLITSSVACVCALTLCVCLPISLSHSANGNVMSSQIGTETPPDETKPPNPSTDSPGVEASSPYFEAGFVSNGLGEPISTLMIAYIINRQFDANADNASVQLSFGEYRLNHDNSLGMTNVLVSVYNHDSNQTFTLKNLAAEEFLASEYDVKIKCTIEENDYGELVSTSETRTFNHEEIFSFPSSMFNKDRGVLVFNILAYDGDKDLGGSGVEIYYVKRVGKINIISYREYRELEQSAQTPPRTDITVTPA